MPEPTDPDRYPTGRFVYDDAPGARQSAIAAIASLPSELRAALDGLSDATLDTPYRDGGWTARQVARHLADSHMNALVRVKRALTEEAPVVTPYAQDPWVRLPDAALPLDVPLALLDALHAQWSALLAALSDADFARGYIHTDHGRLVPIDEATQMYAWHGRHHLAHIAAAARRAAD